MPQNTPNDGEDRRDPFDGDYIGNIFGWKVSLIGAAVMVFFVAFIAYRHWALDVPVGFEDPLDSEEEKAKYAPAPRRTDTTSIQ